MNDTSYYLESNPKGLKNRLLGFVKDNTKTLSLEGNYLKISEAKKVSELYVPDISAAQIHDNQGTHDLKNYAFQHHQIHALELTHERHIFYLESKHFDPNKFIEFTKKLQNSWTESRRTFDEKLDVIYQKCEQNIRRDKRLETEFQNKLNEIYNSVYQVYQTDKKNPNYQQILKHPDTVYYFLNRYNYYYYYRRNFYRPNTTAQTIETVENMIKTVQLNLNVARSRMESYRKIQEDLQRRKIDYQSKKKLAQIAQDLENLQAQNMQEGFKKHELDYDTEVIEQLDILTDTIGEITTEEKSEMLQTHILSFAEMTENENEILKALNQKLKI